MDATNGTPRIESVHIDYVNARHTPDCTRAWTGYWINDVMGVDSGVLVESLIAQG